jgi:hypothetical protein
MALNCADGVRSGPARPCFLLSDESVRQTPGGRLKIGPVGQTGAAARLLHVCFANWDNKNLNKV